MLLQSSASAHMVCHKAPAILQILAGSAVNISIFRLFTAASEYCKLCLLTGMVPEALGVWAWVKFVVKGREKGGKKRDLHLG